MSLGKAVKKVLWFELIWKVLVLGLINPLFRETSLCRQSETVLMMTLYS